MISERTKALRTNVYAHYGYACVDCGEDDPDKLTIDHIHEDGGAQRRTLKRHSAQWYTWIIEQGYPDDLALRCWNDNVAKQRRYQRDQEQRERTAMPPGIGKCQINPVISELARQYLDEQAKLKKCSVGQIIEALIEDHTQTQALLRKLADGMDALLARPAYVPPTPAPVPEARAELLGVGEVSELPRRRWWTAKPAMGS